MNPDFGFRYDPSVLGPLNDRIAHAAAPVEVFEGEGDYLSPRKLDARADLCQEIAPILGRILDPEETVLHVLPALHYPRFLDSVGFGAWWSRYFRVALVLTDRRLIEILMRDGRRVGTRIWSYSWGQMKDLKMGLGTLRAKPVKGRTQKWKVIARGDRKLLKLLVPKIKQLFPVDVPAALPVPLWHCPECGAPASEHPSRCRQCNTEFKSRRLAAALSLAIPGAGLYYAGHPVLATVDLLGELFLYAMAASLLLTSTSAADTFGALFAGVVFLFLTKLESVHLASMLAQRTKVERGRRGWRLASKVGAVASVVLLALPLLLVGSFGNKLDRDMDLSANVLGWSGGHDPDQWQFGIDPGQRSEWIHENGRALFVWSFTLGAGETYESMVTALNAQGQGALVEPISIAGFDGLGVTQTEVDDQGDPFVWTRWILFDREFKDLHMIGVAAEPDEVESVKAEVKKLLEGVEWNPVQ